MRRCPATRCPTLISDQARYCPDHARHYEARRGNTRQRGYGQAHQAERARWATTITTLGSITCPKCGHLILAGEPFDLGHTTDRAGWTGPEHPACNRADGGQRGAAARNT